MGWEEGSSQAWLMVGPVREGFYSMGRLERLVDGFRKCMCTLEVHHNQVGATLHAKLS